MRYYVSWKTTGYYSKDSLKLAARCPVSGCWPSCTFLLSAFPGCPGKEAVKPVSAFLDYLSVLLFCKKRSQKVTEGSKKQKMFPFCVEK